MGEDYSNWPLAGIQAATKQVDATAWTVRLLQPRPISALLPHSSPCGRVPTKWTSPLSCYTTGANEDSLKVRPPLICQSEHFDLFLAAVERALIKINEPTAVSRLQRAPNP